MKIVWDEPKRLANLASRRLDFADLVDGAFFLSAALFPAKKGRMKAVGVYRDLPHTVIFKVLGREAISIVSFRRASRREREQL